MVSKVPEALITFFSLFFLYYLGQSLLLSSCLLMYFLFPLYSAFELMHLFIAFFILVTVFLNYKTLFGSSA